MLEVDVDLPFKFKGAYLKFEGVIRIVPQVIWVGNNRQRPVQPVFKAEVNLAGSWYGGRAIARLNARCNSGIRNMLHCGKPYGVRGQFGGNVSSTTPVMKVVGTPISVEPLPVNMLGQNNMLVEGVETIVRARRIKMASLTYQNMFTVIVSHVDRIHYFVLLNGMHKATGRLLVEVLSGSIHFSAKDIESDAETGKEADENSGPVPT
ncbi:hypothetical protein PCANC_17367 [Puccinia coronata f. sp. avenae]|uniref:Uncharacterized protein n=1 Tax=Puccinia coronata f. sp. avenae TaxID=200324 RepID=A0A2N5TXW5_9BASI|nr:hypothetical protein PCANC_24502 [Puccinia coronata f. sp. avenae]PLW32757.1 hypothetical protein PCANC_17367 [Puccinia coronata f. sp. avenae]